MQLENLGWKATSLSALVVVAGIILYTTSLDIYQAARIEVGRSGTSRAGDSSGQHLGTDYAAGTKGFGIVGANNKAELAVPNWSRTSNIKGDSQEAGTDLLDVSSSAAQLHLYALSKMETGCAAQKTCKACCKRATEPDGKVVCKSNDENLRAALIFTQCRYCPLEGEGDGSCPEVGGTGNDTMIHDPKCPGECFQRCTVNPELCKVGQYVNLVAPNGALAATVKRIVRVNGAPFMNSIAKDGAGRDKMSNCNSKYLPHIATQVFGEPAHKVGPKIENPNRMFRWNWNNQNKYYTGEDRVMLQYGENCWYFAPKDLVYTATSTVGRKCRNCDTS